MKKNSIKKSAGSALIVSLVLLAVGVILGTSTMQSTFVDESLSGNYYAASRSEMAAEKAASLAFDELVNDLSTSFSELAQDAEVLSGLGFNGWGEFSDDSGIVACGTSVCRYSYVYVDGGGNTGIEPGHYLVGMGAVLNSTNQVVAESNPVVLRVKPQEVVGYGGISAALTVFGGIYKMNQGQNNWISTSENSEIQGGVYGPESDNASLDSIYYEGEAFDGNTPAGKNPFVDGMISAGDPSEYAMEWLGVLYNTIMDYDLNNPDNSFVLTTEAEVEDAVVGKDDACSTYHFAVIESSPDISPGGGNNPVSGESKFCGVYIALGGNASIGGTAIVEGLAIVANPVVVGEEYDWTQPSEEVNLTISGGGGSGSVFFDELGIDQTFSNIGEDYMDYLDGGGFQVVTVVGYDIVSWQ